MKPKTYNISGEEKLIFDGEKWHIEWRDIICVPLEPAEGVRLVTEYGFDRKKVESEPDADVTA